MKPSRRTTSHRTTSRRTQRDAHEDAAAQMPNSPNPASAPSEDQLRATADAPLSLRSGAGRQYWDEVLRLLVNIRADCDAAAERLGYVSRKDDGLAAVEYIANKILEAVQGERHGQHIVSASKQSASRPSDVPQQSATEARHKSNQRAQPAQPTIHSERAKLIGELKQMLRDGKTKAGAVIDPQLAHEIAKHITILNEDLAQPETAQSIKRIRERLARFFGKVSGDCKTPKKFAKAAVGAVAQKPKLAKPEPSRPKKSKTTVSERSVSKRSVTKGSKGAKRRSR
jgi:hypothetical protein